jgi:hypothetical protein
LCGVWIISAIKFLFNKFKSAIFKLYPSSESERKWTIAEMDKLVREQLLMGILDDSDLRN